MRKGANGKGCIAKMMMECKQKKNIKERKETSPKQLYLWKMCAQKQKAIFAH